MLWRFAVITSLFPEDFPAHPAKCRVEVGEADCPAVGDGNCPTCSSDLMCKAGSCDVNYFNEDCDANTCCGAGCQAVDDGSGTTCPSAFTRAERQFRCQSLQ